MKKGQIVQVLLQTRLEGARGRIEGFTRDNAGREFVRIVFDYDGSPSGNTSFWFHVDDLMPVTGTSVTNITRLVHNREKQHSEISAQASARKERKKHA